MDLSFVLPAHNEEGSLPQLLREIREVAAEIGGSYEIVVVDDGSTDGTLELLRREREKGDLVLGRNPRNRGQSAALSVGLQIARGKRLVTMDSDLQNHPHDAAKLLAALEDADLAIGVRQKRRDTIWKRIGSRIGNGVRRLFLRDGFKDTGCALRAWRAQVARTIPHFNGFHRFAPALAKFAGFRVTEVMVSHRHREHGATHYNNFSRAVRGFRDLFGVGWLRKRRLEIADYVVEDGPRPESASAPEADAR